MTVSTVEKAKLLKDGTIGGKVRFAPRGFMQRKWNHSLGKWTMIEKAENAAPTCHRISHRVMDVLGKSRNGVWIRRSTAPGNQKMRLRRLVPFIIDFGAAFFSSDPFPDDVEGPWIEVPKGDPKFTRTVANGKAYEAYQRGEKVVRQLKREVPGTKAAPAAWYHTLCRVLLDVGCVRSKFDPCMFYFTDSLGADMAWSSSEDEQGIIPPGGAEADIPWTGNMGVHVDDAKGRASRAQIKFINQELQKRNLEIKLQVIEVGEIHEYTGVRYTEKEDSIELDQYEYIDKKCSEMQLDKGRAKLADDEATEEEVSAFRSCAGSAGWAIRNSRHEHLYELQYANQVAHNLRVKDIKRFNKTVKALKETRTRYKMTLPRLDLTNGIRVVGVGDAGEGEQLPDVWSKAIGGKVIGIMSYGPLQEKGPFAVVDVRSGPLKRVTHSSFDAETVNVVETYDWCLAVALVVEEYLKGIRPSRRGAVEMRARGEGYQLAAPPTVQVELHTDAMSLIDRTDSLKLDSGLSKRRKADVADLQEGQRHRELRPLGHLDGKMNPTDGLTKPAAQVKQGGLALLRILKDGVYEPRRSERTITKFAERDRREYETAHKLYSDFADQVDPKRVSEAMISVMQRQYGRTRLRAMDCRL